MKFLQRLLINVASEKRLSNTLQVSGLSGLVYEYMANGVQCIAQ